MDNAGQKFFRLYGPQPSQCHGMLAFRAKYVFPIDRPPLCDGVVAIDHDRIVAVGPSNSPAIHDLLPSARDLGDVAILPGLINPHTHLEFSHLKRPLGVQGMAFPDWIHEVVQFRQMQHLSKMSPEELLKEAEQGRLCSPVDLGIGESTENGITTLGNIEFALRGRGKREPLTLSAIKSGRARHIEGLRPDPSLKTARNAELTVFLEVLAFRRDAVEDALASLNEVFRESVEWWQETERLGLSPHAPYSVHPDVIEQMVAISSDRRIPIAHHLAESREELMLLRAGAGPLRSGIGPFVDLLAHLDAWDPLTIPFGSRPLDYLQTLSKSHRALVIHGNYLDDEEIAYVGAHAENMSVVYCPRTHAYFRHDPYPLAKMLAAGVNVAIGTDSRASNPDLSVLADMRFAAKQHPLVPVSLLLQMITASAAKALGRDDEIGTLTPGKFADLAILSLPKHDAADLHELLLDPQCNVKGTIFRGRQVFGESLGETPA